MNGDEDAQEVQECGQDCLNSNIRIRHANHLCHQEGSSTHDRRHDLSTGRSGGFNSTREFGTITGFLHQWDRNRTGGNRIGNGRAGNHTAESGRNNRNLCRTAFGCASNGVSHLNEEIGNTGSFEERPEDDEQHNVSGANANRRTDNARRSIEEVIDDHAQGLALSKGIDNKEAGHKENRQADDTAACFCKDNNTDDT